MSIEWIQKHEKNEWILFINGSPVAEINEYEEPVQFDCFLFDGVRQWHALTLDEAKKNCESAVLSFCKEMVAALTKHNEQLTSK